ncbi:hypothetical protein TIFTF001_027727 [Ficus carica]|uniref:Uncharacterized protein n=1 Tax=Ficus carica TaxID=3494 RepID=A0AA88DNY5_FICCA|nr:hypothetical protein TIFTF001_027727 [Ficus carica]
MRSENNLSRGPRHPTTYRISPTFLPRTDPPCRPVMLEKVLVGWTNFGDGAGHSTGHKVFEKLNGVVQTQSTSVVNLTAGDDITSEKTASHVSTSGREGFESSKSMAPAREPVQSRQCGRSQPLCINGLLVYQMADTEMVDRACDRPVYTVDYFMSAVTSQYLESLREEFEIPNDVEMLVPGPNNLPSRPPPSYITLSAEFFRAGLRFPFHPYLRRALRRLHVAPMKLNANAYLILISFFNYASELPFRAFQNLYWMKTAPLSAGSYYFQGYQGAFIAGCPDSDKNYKHLWFFVSDRWLHGHLPYDEVPSWECVPITFRRGYVWTQGPHTEATNLERIERLHDKADLKRNQNRLLSTDCLAKYNWFGSSSTFDYPHDCPRTMRPREVTVAARMPDPMVHYRARIVTVEVTTTSGQPKVPWGVPVISTYGLQYSSSSPRAWGQRITDEDLDENQGCLSRDNVGASDQDRVARLQQKFAKTGDGSKSHLGSSVPISQPFPDPPVARVIRPREEHLPSKPATRSRREDSRARDPPASVFGAEPASEDMINRLVEVVFLAFLSNAAARGYFNRMEEKVASLVMEVKKSKDAEKEANEKARKAEEQAAKAEEAQKRVEDDLTTNRFEHSRYFQEALPAVLEAVVDYQRLAEFEAHLLVEYKERMRDMKADFAMSNPTVTRVDWSFVLEIFGEIVHEEERLMTGVEDGEVIEGVQVTEDVVVIDELEGHTTLVACGLPEQTFERSCSGASYGQLRCSLERPKSSSGQRPKQGPSSVVRESLKCGVCLCRLLNGPARAPPMVGLGVPWIDPSSTLVGVQNNDLPYFKNTRGWVYLIEVFLILWASSRFSGSRVVVRYLGSNWYGIRSSTGCALTSPSSIRGSSLHITFPGPFLVPSEEPDAVRDRELHGQVTDGRSTTKNSTIRVAIFEPSLLVTGRQIVLAARTHSPANPYNGVRLGVSTAPSIFSLVNASMNIMSTKLPLLIRTRRTTLSAIRIPDQRSVVRVEKFVDLFVCKGLRTTVLAANFHDVLCHIYIFSPSNLPGFVDITSPATRGVTSSNSSKDGVNNVLGFCNSRSVAVSDQQFNLVAQLYAILRIMADVFVEITMLVLVSSCPGVLGGGNKGSILMKPPYWSFWARGRFSPVDIHDSLPLLWYEVFIFRVFAPRNAAAKASASCLNESTDTGIGVAMISRLKGGSTTLTCSNPYRWLTTSALVNPSLSQVIEHGGCAPPHFHEVPPALSRVKSSRSRRWCGCSQMRDLVVEAPRAFSAGVIHLVLLLVSYVPSIGPILLLLPVLGGVGYFVILGMRPQALA